MSGSTFASYSGMQHKDTGRIQSYSVWSKGVDSLLPKTDIVHFFVPSGQDKGELAASAPWERVREVLGDHMHDAALYPPRFRVREFPSPHELTTLKEE